MPRAKVGFEYTSSARTRLALAVGELVSRTDKDSNWLRKM